MTCIICKERKTQWSSSYCNECYKAKQRAWRQKTLRVSTEETKDLFYNQGKRWEKKDQHYLCAFYGSVDKEDLALSLGRSIASIEMQYIKLKRGNWVDRYKEQYWDGEDN